MTHVPKARFLMAAGCLAAVTGAGVLKAPMHLVWKVVAVPVLSGNVAGSASTHDGSPAPPSSECEPEYTGGITSQNTAQCAQPRDDPKVHVRPEPPESQTERFLGAAMEASRSHPFEAVRALSRLHPSAQRDLALAHAVSQWADVAPAEALEWVRQLPEGDLRENLAASVATAVAVHDPVTAANFVNSEMDGGIAQNRAAVAVVQRWAEMDPAAASAWAGKIQEPSVRNDAFHEIAVLGNAAMNMQ